MANNRVMAIVSDRRVMESIKSILGGEYEIISPDAKSALDAAASFCPDLVIIDNDNDELDGFEAFSELRLKYPGIKVIMITGSPLIPPAVLASKKGVNDYMMKPLEPKRFALSVKRALLEEVPIPFAVPVDIEGLEWLKGISGELKELLEGLRNASAADPDIIFFCEQGVDGAAAAELIHRNSKNAPKKLVKLDASSFAGLDETYFWGALTEHLKKTDAGPGPEDELCGTLFIFGLESLGGRMLLNAAEFLSGGRAAAAKKGLDPGIRIIISIKEAASVLSIEKHAYLSDFSKVNIPPLRQRREDIPFILNSLLKKYSSAYSKKVSATEGDLLDMFMAYDWPGNYDELDAVVNAAVLNSKEGTLNTGNAPLNINLLLTTLLSISLFGSDTTLRSLRSRLQNEVFRVFLEKSGNNMEKVSLILDVPREALPEQTGRTKP